MTIFGSTFHAPTIFWISKECIFIHNTIHGSIWYKKIQIRQCPISPPTEGQIGGFPHSIFVFRFDLSILILFNSDFLIWFDFVIRFDPAHTAHILLAFFIWFRYYDSIWLIVSGLICLSVYDSICPIFPVWFNWDYKNLTRHFWLYIF